MSNRGRQFNVNRCPSQSPVPSRSPSPEDNCLRSPSPEDNCLRCPSPTHSRSPSPRQQRCHSPPNKSRYDPCAMVISGPRGKPGPRGPPGIAGPSGNGTGSSGSFDYVAKQDINMNGFNIINFGYSPQLLSNFTQTIPTETTKLSFSWTSPISTLNQNPFMQNDLITLNILLYVLTDTGFITFPILTDSPAITIGALTINNIAGSSSLNGNTFDFYDTSLQNMIDNSFNALAIWYSNRYPIPNVFIAPIKPFAFSGPPSAPNIDPFPLTQPINANSYTISYRFPFTDVINSLLGPPYISVVDISYSTPGSSIRFPSAVSDTKYTINSIPTNNIIPANTPITATLTNMHPSSNYTIAIRGQNNIAIGNYGAFNTGTTLTTIAVSYPSVIQSGGILNTSAAQYSNPNNTKIKLVSTKQPIGTTTPLVNINRTSLITISPFQQIINSNAATIGIGLTGQNLLAVDISFNGLVVNYHLPSPQIQYGGFGQTNTPTYIEPNKISVSGNATDAYASSPEYNQGFYLNSNTNFTLLSNFFSSNGFQNSNFLTNYSIFSKYASSLNYTAITNTSTNFYLDDISANPTILPTPILSFTTLQTTLISGIRVIVDDSNTFVIDASYSNMGNFFYSSPLVTYTLLKDTTSLTTITEPDINNVTSLSMNVLQTSFKSTIQIKNNAIIFPFLATNVYTRGNIKMSIIANNIFGSSLSAFSNALNLLVDVPSTNFVKATTPQAATPNLNTLGQGSALIPGYRIWSGIVRPVPLPPYISGGGSIPTNSATTSNATATGDQGYSSFPYNQLWNIALNSDTNQELLVANGNFTTDPQYYINYSSFNTPNNSSIDYSSIAIENLYRYATFVWNVSAFSSNSLTNIILKFQIPSANQTATLNAMQIFYRTEDSTNLTNFSEGSNSSTWISVLLTNKAIGGSIDNKGGVINGVNLRGFNNNTYRSNEILFSEVNVITLTGNTYSFSIPIYTIQQGKSGMKIYVRFGLPMNIGLFNFGNSSPITLSDGG
jgi:hypothetical protein